VFINYVALPFNSRIFLVGNFVFAQQTLDLKAPGGNEAFGGEQKGTALIVSNEHSVNIVANMTTPPKELCLRAG
jgi:hypothetical protein